MAKSKTKKGSKRGRASSGKASRTRKRKSKVDTALSSRTKKQIDSLPEHAQHIFKKAHANAVKQYQEPEKGVAGKVKSAEEVAHKAAWAAVKQKYKKKGEEWVSKGMNAPVYAKSKLYDTTDGIVIHV